MQIFPLMKKPGFVKILDGFQVPAIAKIERKKSLRHGTAQNHDGRETYGLVDATVIRR